MRWERLFDDLEAELAAAEAVELAAEVSERTRVEHGRVLLHERLAAHDQVVEVWSAGAEVLRGQVLEAAPEWLLLAAPGPVLVVRAAVTGVVGLGVAALVAPAHAVGRRLRLAALLRRLARDRSPVRATCVDGRVLTGTIDAVASDHLDLAEHAADEPRRAQAVVRVHSVPFSGLATLRPAAGTSSLG